MARVKRTGVRETFSVSVTPATKRLLQRAAERRFGGNVSALIEAIALEAERQGALDWLMARSPRMSDVDFDAFMAEMTAPRPRTRARRTA